MKNIILFLFFSFRLAAQSGPGFTNDDLVEDSLQIWVNRILELHQLPPKIQTEASLTVKTVTAQMRDGIPYILYNQPFIHNIQASKQGNWKIIGMFAHEIGHYFLFHLANPSTTSGLELEADQWAGSQLYPLGATLEQALSCFEDVSVEGTFTHPARHLRQQALQQGWEAMKVRDEVRVKHTAPSDFTEHKTGVSFQMKYIAGNHFQMGGIDIESRNEEKPVHTVHLSAFYMGKYEVTVSEFRQFIHATGYKTDAEKEDGSFIGIGSTAEKRKGIHWQHDEYGNYRTVDNYPVIHISWNDAVAYCQWLTKTTGKTYRLPTESEWEYAARGGSTSLYAGSPNITEIAWYANNSGYKLHLVGEKRANGYGLYDMSGNAWEWCNDWNGSYSDASVRNPTGANTGTFRILRGGGWNGDASYCRVARRNRNYPFIRMNYYGFRVVCNLD